MERLPAEIKRIIAFNLLSDDPADGGINDIKQLRLVNRAYAIVAVEPLFSEIYLMLKSESFERMRDVSAHPSYAKFVRSIRYEPDGLKGYRNYSHWIHHCRLARPSLSRIYGPGWRPGDEGMTKYDGKRREYNARVLATTQWLRPQYNAYQTAFQDQKSIRQRDYNRGPFTEAMAQLPNLEQVILNFQYGIMKQTKALKTSFPVTGELVHADWSGTPHGVTQLRSILLGAHDADTKLKVLRCGAIDWRFFQLPEVDMDSIKSALKHLASLHILIHAGVRMMAAECQTFLKGYRLSQFLSAAKNLRSLNLQIDQFPKYIELEYCVGQNTWINLSTVQLSCLATNEDALISFLERHTGTLEDLTLCEVHLVQGDWISALSRVRNAVKLKNFKASYALTSANPHPTGQHWCIDCVFHNTYRETPEKITRSQQLATAIKEYVLNGGDCPLLDHVIYPQRIRCS